MEYNTLCHTMVFMVMLYLGHVAITSADDPVIHEFINTQRRVHELYVQWNVSDEYEVDQFDITSQKHGSQAITYSGLINSTETEYYIEDLKPEHDYKVCFKVTLAEDDKDVCDEAGACEVCHEMSTIRLIRDDSLIAVILTLASIMGLILIGYLCWCCAKKRIEDSADEEAIESKQPILLRVPEKSNGPRRSVDFEDQDIPYIDEVNKDSPATHV